MFENIIKEVGLDSFIDECISIGHSIEEVKKSLPWKVSRFKDPKLTEYVKTKYEDIIKQKYEAYQQEKALLEPLDIIPKYSNAKDIYNQAFPEKDYIVYDYSESGKKQGVLPAKGAIGFGGSIREGKSTFIMELALSVATGRPFLNKFEVKQSKVLYCLTQGDTESIHDKIKSFYPNAAPEGLENLIIDTYRIDNDRVILPSITSISDSDNFATLEEYLEQNKDTRLIILDMVDDYLDLSGKEKPQKMKVTNALNNFARKNNILIIALKHTGKVQKDHFKKSLTLLGDTSELGGYAGTILLRQTQVGYEIQTELREGTKRDMEVEYTEHDGHITITYLGEMGGLHNKRKEVYDVIRDNPLINAKRITEIIYGEDHKDGEYKNVRKEISKLKDSNMIIREGSNKTGGYKAK